MDRRFVSGLFFCLLFVFFYSTVLRPMLFPPIPVPEPVLNGGNGDHGNGEVVEPVEPAEDRLPAAPAEERPHREWAVERDRLRVVFSTTGAVVRSLSVRLGEDGEWVPLWSVESGPHLVVADRDGRTPLDTEEWQVAETEESVAFTYVAAGGWSVTKTFTFDDSYTFRFQARWENPEGGEPAAFAPDLRVGGIERDSGYRYDSYLYACYVEGDNEKIQWSAHQRLGGDGLAVQSPRVRWFGITNRYFATVLAPDTSQQWVDSVTFRKTEFTPEGAEDPEKTISITAANDGFTLQGHQAKTASFILFAGPTRPDVLAEAGETMSRPLHDLLDYTGFNVVGHAILGVVAFFRNITGNYGVAIILMTLFIRLVLLPLSYKGQVSMLAMAKMQPEINRLRERYGKDQRKLLEAQQDLMRRNGVNPMMGCLPLLLQLPVFIGIYSVLDRSIDLRNSPFLWITDLTQPDRLVAFERSFTFVMTVSSFNILPIIMLITWCYQSFTAPRSEDPQMRAQQNMMRFMPIVFGLVCYNLSAGLSLYFFINALWSIGEQKIVRKTFEARFAAAGGIR